MTFTMPELTVMHIGLLAAALIVGVIVGWIFRGRRSNTEKDTISASWQERLDVQRVEMDRLLEQNRDLMEQNSQYLASNKDSKMRAGELSKSLKETFAVRDNLQREIGSIRSNLESAVTERDQLQGDKQTRAVTDDAVSTALQQRNTEIARLTKELEGWQERVPPLIERFKIRNEDAERLQRELAAAQLRIVALEATIVSLEATIDSTETRVEPAALGEDLNASNDPIDERIDTENTHLPEPILKTENLVAMLDSEEADASPPPEEAKIEDRADVDDQIAEMRDNLKMIKGIGPAIQKTLNEMGICRFAQIADMSEYDIDRVAQRLKGFRSRIYREDWIGQARDLQNQTLTGQA